MPPYSSGVNMNLHCFLGGLNPRDLEAKRHRSQIRQPRALGICVHPSTVWGIINDIKTVTQKLCPSRGALAAGAAGVAKGKESCDWVGSAES